MSFKKWTYAHDGFNKSLYLQLKKDNLTEESYEKLVNKPRGIQYELYKIIKANLPTGVKIKSFRSMELSIKGVEYWLADAYANLAPSPAKKVLIKVKDDAGEKITDADVFVDGNRLFFNKELEAYPNYNSRVGSHFVKILKNDYSEYNDEFDVVESVDEYTFVISKLNSSNVKIKNSNGFDDCKVYLRNETTGITYNAIYKDTGFYEVQDVPDGFYTLIADKKPYTQYSQNHINITAETSLNFSLSNIDVYVQESNNVSDVNVLLDGVSPFESSYNLYLFKNVSPGEHTLTANKEGYNLYESTVNVNEGVCLFTLTPVETTSYSISLVVKNDLGDFITDANVLIGSETAIWEDGFYTVSGLKSGYYNIRVTHEGYVPYSETIELIDKDIEQEVKINSINAAFLKVSNNDGLKDYNVYVNGNSLVYNNSSGKYVGYLSRGEYDLKIMSRPFTDIKDTINLTEDTDYAFSFNGYDVIIQEENHVEVDVLLDGQVPQESGDGVYIFKNITEGIHEFTAEYPGYEKHTEFLTVTSQSVNFSFEMKSKHEEYSVSLKLKDEETGELINGAMVKLDNYPLVKLFGDYYNGTVPAGKYQLRITHESYDYLEDDFEVDEVISKEYSLEKTVTLKFKVSAGGALTTDSVVRLNDVDVKYVSSENAYVIKGVKPGVNKLFISEYGYKVIRGNLTVEGSRTYPYTLEKVDNVTFKIHQSGDVNPDSAKLYLNDSRSFDYDSEQKLFIEEDLPVGVYKFKYKPIFRSAWEKEYVIETNTTENINIPESYDVYFKEKNGLTNVTVKLDNLESSITPDGEYLFKNVPRGVYNLTAVLDGYETINENFTVEWFVGDSVNTIEMVEVVEDIKINCKYQGRDIHKDVSVSISNDLNVYGAMYDESNNYFRIRKALKGTYNLNIEHPILTNKTTQVNITPEQKEFNTEFTGIDVKIKEHNGLTNCEITIDRIPPISTTNDGIYYFNNITEGTHTITADHTGYKTKNSRFNASIDNNEFDFELEKDPDFNIYDIQIELTKNGSNYSKAIITSDSFTAQYKDGSYKATGVVEKQHQINIQFEGNTLQRVIDVDEDTQLFKFDLDYRVVTFKGIKGCDVTLNGNAPDSIKLTSTDIYANAFYSFHAKAGTNTLKVNKPGYKQLIQDYYISLDNEIFEFNLEPALNPISEEVAVVSLDRFSDCEVYLDDYHLSREGGDTHIYQGIGIPNGQYTLKVSKNGYIPFEQQITISNYNRRFYFGLVPVNGDTNLYPIDITLETTSTGEMGDVYVDGIHAAHDSEHDKYTLYNISAAKHLLEVFKDGFEPYRKIITVSSLEQSFTAELTPLKKYELKIVDTGKMTGVNVKVDNNTVPYDYDKEAYVTNLVADQYEITVTKNGYDTFNEQIVLLEDTTIKFQLDETPLPDTKVPVHIVPLFQPGNTQEEGLSNTFKQYFSEPKGEYMDVYVDGVKAQYKPEDLYQVGDSNIGSYYAEAADRQHHTVIVNLKYDKLPSDLRKDRFPTREIIYVNSTENPSNMYTVSLNKYDLSFYDVVPVYESEFKVKDVPVMPRMKFKSMQNFKDCIVLVDNMPIFYEEDYDSYILYNALQDNYSSVLTVIKAGYETLEQQFKFNNANIEFTLTPLEKVMDLIVKPCYIDYEPWTEIPLIDSVFPVKNAKVYLDNVQLNYDKKKDGYVYKNGTGNKHRLTIIADGFKPLYKYVNIPSAPFDKGKSFTVTERYLLEEFKGKYTTATIECDVNGANKTCTIPVYRANSKGQYNLKDYDDTLKSLGTVGHSINLLSKYTVYQLTKALLGFYFMIVKASSGNIIVNKELLVNSDKVVEKVNLSNTKKHLNMSWKFRVIDENTKNILNDCNVTLRENVTGFEFPVEYDNTNNYYKVYNVNYYNFTYRPMSYEGGYTIIITHTGYKKKETRLYEFTDEQIFKLKEN